MSTSARVWTWIIAIIVVIAIIWAIAASKRSSPAPAVPEEQATSTQTSQTPADPLAGTGISASSRTSDTDIANDQAAIDQQMTGLNSDAAAVDASTNAQ